MSGLCILERVTGIEPASSAWKAEVLPMNYTRESRCLKQRIYSIAQQNVKQVGKFQSIKGTQPADSRTTTSSNQGAKPSEASTCKRKALPPSVDVARRDIPPRREPRATRNDPDRRQIQRIAVLGSEKSRRQQASDLGRQWSGRQDSNLRHPAPKAGALPNCATSRNATVTHYTGNPGEPTRTARRSSPRRRMRARRRANTPTRRRSTTNPRLGTKMR